MTTHKPHLSLSLSLLLSFLTIIPPITANTEKVIFTAPPPISLETLTSSSSAAAAAFNHNSLPVLGPSTSFSIRTNLTRVFPHNTSDNEQQDEQQRGYPSWLVLEDLTPGQRYELRVCWSALEPTEFSLDIYPLNTILSTPHLLQSLSQHTTSLSLSPSLSTPKQQQQQPQQHQDSQKPPPNETSILLLRVLAAADYFSHHQSLMKDPPPPVLVDLILDPYIYNVLPQSLVPTVCYLVVVGIASWFVARWAAKALTAIAGSDDKDKKQN
ncbi:uncharacterized protein TRIREDRAFT_105051 [Trichoderma reesei QM6a]|uniref:Predicted protein n=2 Tax=Hypocrea jecorina TaxID=51453 RepID=G0RDA7_HYPJQ|nr:uncharacterized protein TRIREDRAFT_105051 [Trichoderma reesei QM6a]EGR50708.1 predicted protein [Trichoderma reesei QM6a]ETS05696.1 hypothetical protein M419DRAFT_72107 [Trichoderma reesei RUT C-30]